MTAALRGEPFDSREIPGELRQLRQWVGWRLEPRAGTEKLAKVPLRPFDGAHASTTDPTSWGSFEDALECPGAAGVGFVFSSADPYVGIDLDHCRNPESGVIEPWAMRIVERLDSYTELSPSYTGLHVFVRATLPPSGRRSGPIEMYCAGRFFTVTGLRVPGTREGIAERDAELRALHEEVFAAAQPTVVATHVTPASLQLALTDDELIARAMGALNGDKLQRLWSGDRTGYQSDSESDLALCSLLAFWCGPDQGRIDRLFRSSALMRPKWDERRGTRTYGELTIAKSLDGGEFWDPNARFLPEQSLANDPKLNDFALTDSGNAEAFAYLHAGNVVYDHRGGRWLIWSEHRWVADAVGQIHLLAKHTVRSRLQAAAAVPEDGARGKAAKHHLSSESRQRLEALLALARSEPAISDAGDRWDADPRLLAAQNGVIDLASGALRPGKPSDRITLGLSIPYDPEATCPRFERFLEEVFLGDRATIEFIQRAVGYSLTGDTTEHAFFLLYGTGRNGKSVLLNVLRALAGAYSHNLPFSAFELTARANLSPELAQLPGKRLVTSSETNDGTRLNEARIKALTGGDPITANPKYVAPFEFVPVAKFWLAVNHLPNVRDDSEGFWRRMRQIDFKRTFSDEEVDRDLERKLREELPGILTWAVRGAIEWHRSGLAEPEKVKRATLEYREQSDVLHEFISDRCVLSPNAVVRSSELYRAYTSWCDDCGVASRERLSLQAFGRRLGTRFVRHATKQGKGYRGIGLLSTVLSGDGLVSGDGYRGHLPELSPEQPREEEFWQKGSISVTSAISVTPPTCGNDCGRPVERQGELCDACLAEAVEVPREQRGGGMET